MNAFPFKRSDTAGGLYIDGKIQSQRAGMEHVKRPEIESASRQVSTAGRLSNNGRATRYVGRSLHAVFVSQRCGHGRPRTWFDQDDSQRTGVERRCSLGNIQCALDSATLFLNLFLQQSDGVDQLLGTRRAAGNVYVDRNHLIHTLHQRVIIEHPA
jgi:hypothetical protein